MTNFKRIDLRQNTVSLSVFMNNKNTETFQLLKGLIETNNATNEDLIFRILSGVEKIEVKLLDFSDHYEIATKKDLDYISSIANFLDNKYTVKGVYFEDLKGLDYNYLMDSEIHYSGLSPVSTLEEKELFLRS